MPDVDHLGLEEQICFALYRASHALTARYREFLAPLGVTYPQYLALLVLWESAGPSTVRELGERLQLDSGTLSPLLRRLDAAGLITRSRGAHDERVVLITLTTAGRRLRAKARRIPGLVCDATGLTVADLQRLRRDVDALGANVRTSA